jgi:hypothetical protein
MISSYQRKWFLFNEIDKNESIVCLKYYARYPSYYDINDIQFNLSVVPHKQDLNSVNSLESLNTAIIDQNIIDIIHEYNSPSCEVLSIYYCYNDIVYESVNSNILHTQNNLINYAGSKNFEKFSFNVIIRLSNCYKKMLQLDIQYNSYRIPINLLINRDLNHYTINSDHYLYNRILYKTRRHKYYYYWSLTYPLDEIYLIDDMQTCQNICNMTKSYWGVFSNS